MSVEWQGYFTSLNRTLEALGGVPPTPTSPGVLAAAYKGNWSGITTYFPGDEVSNNSNLFRCLIENLNVSPTNGAYWLLIGPTNVAAGGAAIASNGVTSGTVNTTGIQAGAATDVNISVLGLQASVGNSPVTVLTLNVGPYSTAMTVVVTCCTGGAASSSNTHPISAFLQVSSVSQGIVMSNSVFQAGPMSANGSYVLAGEGVYSLPANTTDTLKCIMTSNSSTTDFYNVASGAILKAEVIKR